MVRSGGNTVLSLLANDGKTFSQDNFEGLLGLEFSSYFIIISLLIIIAKMTFILNNFCNFFSGTLFSLLFTMCVLRSTHPPR